MDINHLEDADAVNYVKRLHFFCFFLFAGNRLVRVLNEHRGFTDNMRDRRILDPLHGAYWTADAFFSM
jgi:hypothetical protein